MTELNQETADSILDGFKVLTAIHEYNPSHSIELSSLGLKTSPAKHHPSYWARNFIENFLIEECVIEQDYLNDGMELFNALKDADCLDAAFESFLESEEAYYLDIENIQLEDIEPPSNIFDEFIKYLEQFYKITLFSISSPLLSSYSDATISFSHLLPFYLSSHLDLLTGYILYSNLLISEDKQKGTLVFFIDSYEQSNCIETNFCDELKESYIQVFIDNLKQMKKRHSQI